MPKVYSGSNLFGLKVPTLETRKRSGSMGDAYGLSATRLTQSLDEAEEENEDDGRSRDGEDDTRRLNALLGGKKMKANIELRELRKTSKQEAKVLPKSPSKVVPGDVKPDMCPAAPSSEANASLLTPFDPKDNAEFTSINIPEPVRDTEPRRLSVAKPSLTSATSVEGRVKTLKSSLKSCTAPILGGSEPAEILDVECSELGSSSGQSINSKDHVISNANQSGTGKDHVTPNSNQSTSSNSASVMADGKVKEDADSELSKIVFFTNPIIHKYDKNTSNS